MFFIIPRWLLTPNLCSCVFFFFPSPPSQCQLLYLVTLTYYHCADRALPVWAAGSSVYFSSLLFFSLSAITYYHWKPSGKAAGLPGPPQHSVWQTLCKNKERKKVCQKLVCGMKVLILCDNQGEEVLSLLIKPNVSNQPQDALQWVINTKVSEMMQLKCCLTLKFRDYCTHRPSWSSAAVDRQVGR